VREKHRLYRLSLNYPEFAVVYRDYRNSLCAKISKAKSLYYRTKFGNSSRDIKSTWKLINKILKPNFDSPDLKLEDGDNFITGSEEIANTFNDYFSSVATDLASRIPTVSTDPLSYVGGVENTFVFFECTADEIDRTIISFPSKGSALSMIPSFVFKYISSEIAPLISMLINSCVADGKFPDFMKKARTVPIHKSGSKLNNAITDQFRHFHFSARYLNERSIREW